MDQDLDQETKTTERVPRRRGMVAGAALLASVAAIGAAALGTGSATAAPDTSGTSARTAQDGTAPEGGGTAVPRGDDCPERGGDQEGAGTAAGTDTAPQPTPSGGTEDGYLGV